MVASTAPSTRSGLYADPREDWLALHTEPVIDPLAPLDSAPLSGAQPA